MFETRRGFSLIELILVTLALGVLASVLIPNENLRSFNLEMAARRLEQDLRYARELATTTNVNHGVNLVAGGPYTVYQGNIKTPALNPHTKENYIINVGATFRNVSILNNFQVEFNTLGQPVLGGGKTVQLGDGVDAVTLSVTAGTGLIQRQ